MNDSARAKLIKLGTALIDQQKARVIVPPNESRAGFWFGGGNMVEFDDALYLVGRFRNAGDSTTGLSKGERGLELAVFRSTDGGGRFERVFSRAKADLSPVPGEVVSIEGTALNRIPGGVELFISTEKGTRAYPDELAAFQKPSTGVWTIDRLAAEDIAGLADAEVVPLLESIEPEYLHVKDPVVHTEADWSTALIFCTHPFNWSSSNSAYCVRPSGGNATGAGGNATDTGAPGRGGFDEPRFDFFRRGFTWDVAATRITDVLSLDGTLIGESGTVQLVFYDGAECLRPHTENKAAVSRPRGYSCEELGGLAVTTDDDLDRLERLTVLGPVFVSPYGSGSSRYPHTLTTDDGIYATWQQAQADGSQPLVMNFLSWDEVRQILTR